MGNAYTLSFECRRLNLKQLPGFYRLIFSCQELQAGCWNRRRYALDIAPFKGQPMIVAGNWSFKQRLWDIDQ